MNRIELKEFVEIAERQGIGKYAKCFAISSILYYSVIELGHSPLQALEVTDKVCNILYKHTDFTIDIYYDLVIDLSKSRILRLAQDIYTWYK